jgi:hypothetical protein
MYLLPSADGPPLSGKTPSAPGGLRTYETTGSSHHEPELALQAPENSASAEQTVIL